MIYVPQIRENIKLANVPSAWGDIPTILKDIIVRFNLKTNIALEFGVDFGFSTSALSNYFIKVIGVDTFRDTCRDGILRESKYTSVVDILKDFSNIELIESRYEAFIKNNDNRYDLIHIDILHDYEPTFGCGEWSLQHSDCVIFHDTVSFPCVNQVCEELSIKYGFDYYNYPYSYGLGILIKTK
jgi:predicted O-methyltransferase YrrM